MMRYQRSVKIAEGKVDTLARVDTFPWLHDVNLYFSQSAALNSVEISERLDLKKLLGLLNNKEMEIKAACSLRVDHSPPSSTSETLKKWIDEWLDSAKDAQGSEDPRDRNFDEAPVAALAVSNYSVSGKILLLPSSQGKRLMLAFDTAGARRLVFKSLRHLSDSVEDTADPVDSKRLKSEYDADAEWELMSKLLGWSSEDDPAELLVLFLLSNIRLKLARCRNEICGTYFLLKHWNRRYKNGTFCASCQRSRSLESAVKATKEGRLRAKQKVYELAANRFAKQIRTSPDWYKDAKLKNSIAIYLTGYILRSVKLQATFTSGPRIGVTGKWVAHPKNRRGIESVLKRED